MALVREDQKGLYIKINGCICRPGNVPGYDHAFRMDAADIKAGDKVKAKFISGSPLSRINLDNNVKLYWHVTEYTISK